MNQSKFVHAWGMFDHACDFSAAADLLWKRESKGCDQFNDYSAPSIVCYALSCEIFLKVLCLCYTGSICKEHALEKLFEKLPAEVKDNLKKQFDCSYDGKEDSFWWKDELQEFSKAFVKWRYLYESGESVTFASTVFFVAFRDALREECCKVMFGKNWNDYKEGNRGSIG